MSDFKAALAAARAAVPDTETIAVALGDQLVTLKFKALPSTTWTAITGVHPPRPDNPLDMNYGYNWHASADDAAALSVVRVEDGKDVPFERADGDTEAVDEWADLLEFMSSPDLTQIRNAVWGLNEFAPGARTEALKKASTVNSKRKRA
jgi:hypothetical protein